MPRPTRAAEDTLKALLLAEHEGSPPPTSTGRLADDLGVSPGTATAMVKSLADGGLVEHVPYQGASLTRQGRRAALAVLRRHRLLELFLTRVMGYDWSEVHPEAEILEHAVSERFVRAMDRLLDHPRSDPHGDPIPGEDGELPDERGWPLPHTAAGSSVRISRVRDQQPGFLARLAELGLVPGARVILLAVDRATDTLTLRLAGGGTVQLGERAANRISVEPAEAG